VITRCLLGEDIDKTRAALQGREGAERVLPAPRARCPRDQAFHCVPWHGARGARWGQILILCRCSNSRS